MHPRSRRPARRVHGAEFKAKVLAQCRESGLSVAAVAQANGLNANLVRKWMEGRGLKRCGLAGGGEAAVRALVPTQPAGAPRFVPVDLAETGQSELARTQLVDGLAQMRQQRELQVHATTVDDAQVRGLLRRLFDELCDLPQDEEARRTHARRALAEVLERIVLDPSNLSVQPHYAVQTGVILASPRGFEPLLQP